ncbi:hypothetical protein LOK49_LG02G01130 [Camellia lanceoleosa]|uniref:Uncharacterized protein n=1 Tax=Camellia lanceoleosa TaxID=1840588 RepID=A0ACC0IKH7_9ERIC|nr:hypothetical protein LOK49_LG02G01130 [Camellia lanceoleosa]
MPCIRTCMYGHGRAALRKRWDHWDLRALVVCILLTQLYLHVFGRLRRKSTMGMMIITIVWLIYLLSDLFATLALGKLSKLQGNDEDIDAVNLLKGLWAPIILFFLGGPDTMTILRLEENQMWLKHLTGLLTLGLRTVYITYLTWDRKYVFYLLTLLLLFPGLLKYGERVWVIKSRAMGKYEGFVELDQSTISKISNAPALRPNGKLVLQAYSYFHILKPHALNYEPGRSDLGKLVKEFHELVVERGSVHNTFKLIEIELGLMYDMLFSKIGTIFTLWGSILRFISMSCIVLVLTFLVIKLKNPLKPPADLHIDLPITITLLAGALLLEIAGVLEQLGSDWAIVWAFKHYPSKLVTPIFDLHELVIFKSKRWSELMGQFSLLNFCIKKKSKMFNDIVEQFCGREKMWARFCLPSSPIHPSLKELIINQLQQKAKHISEVETSQVSTMKISEWTLGSYGYQNEFKWIIDLEFEESIVVWHVATDVCYHSELEGSRLVTDEIEATKTLSYYMMYLLFMCRYSLPFCNNNAKVLQAYNRVKKFFEARESASSKVEPYKLLLQRELDSDNMTINNIHKLVRSLMDKENKWKIMSNVWVEMLCYAANQCPVKNHVQELRQGGQFVTHVWLLLMHFGVRKRSEGITFQPTTHPKH